MTRYFRVALSYVAQGWRCDRCDITPSRFAVMCSNGCYHPQCQACALYTDKERRIGDREFAWMN